MVSDEEFMKEAMELAKLGKGKTSPNPAVGCVIVRGDRIIGRGYHEKAGEAHAEIRAIEDATNAGKDVKGATMYVTLEPCCHQGKTPPCTDAIIASGISRVVFARKDPNPLVCGMGGEKLRRAGVEIRQGVLDYESGKMNEFYEKFVTTKKPFVIAKAALSIDGKLAASDGSSKWITGEEARNAVQKMRSRVDAVLVGINTILKDDPQLTCRLPDCKSPVRVVLDSQLKIPLDAKVLGPEAKTIIATTDNAPLEKMKELKKLGVKVIMVGGREGKISLSEIIKELAAEGITSVLIEGGGQVIGSAFDEQLVDKILFFIAPKYMGGTGMTILGKGAKNIGDTISLERVEMTRIGNDYLLIGYPKYTK